MIPTSARRGIVIKTLIYYSTGQVTPRRRIEKKTTSQSSAEAPSYTQVQLDLALVHCPSINRNNPEGETNKQTSNMCTSDKGKQTNKQISGGGMCRGADAGGSAELRNMWSLICNVSEYVEELRRCIRKVWSLICRVIL